MNIITEEMLEFELENAPVVGTREGNAEYADYIKAGFLSSFLHEDNEAIVKNLVDLQMRDSVTESDICNALVNVTVSNIGSAAKLEAMQKILDVYSEQIELDELNEASTLLEYAGNPGNNKILIRLMKEMETLFQQYYEELVFTVDSLDKIVDIVSKEAKKGDKCNAKSAAYAVEAVFKKVEAKFSDKDYKDYVKKYNTTFSALKNICNTFGVKFNDVVMEDKKAFDIKLSAAVKKVKDNKNITKWLPDRETNSTEIISQVNDALDKLFIDNKDATNSIVRYLQPIYNHAYTNINGYIGNVNYIRRVLGLEKEDTIFYKILNKVIKTKK